jgi:hypothetical protein
MPDFDCPIDPLPYLVRNLRPSKSGETFDFVEQDRLMQLSTNVHMLQAITTTWRNVLSQNNGKGIDVYSDGMLAYEICQSIAYLCSEEATGDRRFTSILKLKNEDAFYFKVFEALEDYLELLQETGDIGNDIWKRAMEAMYSVCIKSETCRSTAESIRNSDNLMHVNSLHWSVQLDLSE